MKCYYMLPSLLVLFTSVFITGMDRMIETVPNTKKVPKISDQYLHFVLNKDKEIVEYGCNNMEFFCPPEDFLGKRMTKVVPLSEADQRAIKIGMHNARKNRQEQTVSYALQGTAFNAAIKYRSKNEQYRVKITNQ